MTLEFQPFSRLSPPFAIGLAPIVPDSFVYLDENYQEYLAQKLALYDQKFDTICKAEPDTQAAQEEILELVSYSLKASHPIHFEDQANQFRNQLRAIPIAAAGLMIQDDLLLLRKDEGGWRLVAGSLCFPSSWSLQEKFGLPLEKIHDPVPMNEKMHARIRRIFDVLRPDTPLWRENWSIDNDGELRHDRLEDELLGVKTDLHKPVFLRGEYQTVHKLPKSGDILFTVGVRSKSLEELSTSDRGRDILTTLSEQFAQMSDAEKRYKNIYHHAEVLNENLAKLKTTRA